MSTALSAEEKSLTGYLLYMANCGFEFPLSRTMVKTFAWAIAKWSNTNGRCNADVGPGDY